MYGGPGNAVETRGLVEELGGRLMPTFFVAVSSISGAKLLVKWVCPGGTSGGKGALGWGRHGVKDGGPGAGRGPVTCMEARGWWLLGQDAARVGWKCLLDGFSRELGWMCQEAHGVFVRGRSSGLPGTSSWVLSQRRP